jgi:hypothetical protein
MFAPPPPETLDIPEDHPVARRLRGGADGGLLVLRRAHDDKGNLRRDITVDVTRKLQGFFGLSAPDGGRRVVIIDAADDMNVNAANALLKALEEPPENAVLLLVAHQPSTLLPTIRSRCRELRLGPLGAADMAQALRQAGIELPADTAALTELSAGSVGEAIRFFKLEATDVTVFHDELDLAPGKLRLKQGGGHAGHNGLRSIHGHIGEDYARVRLGIGHPGHKDRVAGFVLSDFASADQDWLDDMMRGIAEGAPMLAAGEGPKFLNTVAQRMAPARPAKPAPSAAEPPKPKPHATSTSSPAKPEKPPVADTRSALEKLMDRFR